MQAETQKAVDSIQQRITAYASGLSYADLTPEAIRITKVRVIDTLGVLIGGFFGEPGRLARNLAAAMPNPNGATVMGTRMKTTPDMAAFVNATTARFAELTDSYHWPGSVLHGHASDTVMPVLAVAEHVRANGRDLMTGLALAYEVYLRISDVFKNEDFDNTNFGCIGTAVAAGKLLGLTPAQLSHCISMAVVPNNTLRQIREGQLSMFKVTAAGQAGRSGVFAALLARAGMEGPHLPFEGKSGWCDHIARERIVFDTWGGNGTQFKILDPQIKIRPSNGLASSCILAAEKVAPIKNIKAIQSVTVEMFKRGKEHVGTGEQQWNPGSRETADHSGPYVVAATLMDGTVTPRSYNDAHLWNPELRALMQKISVVENPEFTVAFNRLPVEHRTRVTVVMSSGERLVGETGGEDNDMAVAKSDAQIEEKFRMLSEDILGAKRVNSVLERLWNLQDMADVAAFPQEVVLG